ncbi:hypothetical protein Y032_0003g1223 [Ancylostoma ceylanicum]|uniref:Uncharacterized protein n=1 Tax=Ancylostoma ceylanicum TaxID=53326 RepID=A0A016VXK5_9BILA|nr:hypothetical protein Y032_0003g1223 [Ancylostoma ceylanicum]
MQGSVCLSASLTPRHSLITSFVLFLCFSAVSTPLTLYVVFSFEIIPRSNEKGRRSHAQRHTCSTTRTTLQFS